MFKYLKHYKKLFIYLSIIYSVAILLLHDTMVNFSIYLMNLGGLEVYNQRVMLTASIIGVAFFGFVLIRLFKNQNQRVVKGSFLLLFSALLYFHARFLLEMNVELIHTIQYAILGILLLFATHRFTLSAVLALCVMIVDEVFQYLYLYPYYVQYFEFNDIVLDLLAVSWTFTALWILGFVPQKSESKWFKNTELILLVAIWVIFVLGLSSCVFVLYPSESCSYTIFVFNKLNNPQLLWQVHEFTGAQYHVISPWNGMLVISAIIAVIYLMQTTANLSLSKS